MKTLLAIALMLSPATAPAKPSIAVGRPFPIVALPLCDNPDQADSIVEFRGRKLMLHLFASW